MIEQISLSNFKGFQKLENLTMAPVTILCGSNSSGKSSVLQSLLLLKQTLESRNRADALLLNGGLAHLGSLGQVIYGHDNHRKIVLSFTFKPGDPTTDTRMHFSLTMSLDEMAESDQYYNAGRIAHLEFTAAADQGSDPGHKQIELDERLEISESKDSQYEVSWKNLKSSGGVLHTNVKTAGTALAHVTFTNLGPTKIEAVNPQEQELLNHVLVAFNTKREALLKVVEGISYLGPLREEPSRRYIYENEAVEIGVKGENAAYIYSHERYNPVAAQPFFLTGNNQFAKEPSEMSLGAALNRWFALLGVNEFSPNQVEEIIRLTLRSELSDGTLVNVADVGFGVSQVFPILLEGLRLPKGGMLLLEQPEIHLHPKLEMQMADFFISLALAGKHVVVETHSDHIVNRLVRRIVEDDSGKMKSLISIHFFTPSPDGSQVESVRIDDERGIVNWPSGFFDQAPNEQELIIRAGLRKRLHKQSV